MKKVKIEPCPFCGKIPSGKSFASTDHGPALMCERCSSMGPPALKKEMVGFDERRFEKLAIEAWNLRAFDSRWYRFGIEAVASFVEQFNKYVSHPYLLSDCILGKFNLIGKRKIRKNSQLLVKAFSAAIHYFQVRSANPKKFHPARTEAVNQFDRAMGEFCRYVDRRTPVRRKGERRVSGGPEFILGSLLSSERRQVGRREGAVRRRS